MCVCGGGGGIRGYARVWGRSDTGLDLWGGSVRVYVCVGAGEEFGGMFVCGGVLTLALIFGVGLYVCLWREGGCWCVGAF